MIEFKCVEAICRALKKAYPNMQVNSYGYGDMMDYDKRHKYINKNEYVKANIIRGGYLNQFDFDKNSFEMPNVVEFWWNGNMINIQEICDIMVSVAKKYGCDIIRPVDRESVKLVEGSVSYILENRWYDGREDGWFGGWNKKYHDVLDYVPQKNMARRYENINDAKKIADYLNKNDWNFHIVAVVEK